MTRSSGRSIDTAVTGCVPIVLPAELPTAFLQLAIHALALYPLAFPQVTRMITHKAPTDPAFQVEWTAFLDELARRIAR